MTTDRDKGGADDAANRGLVDRYRQASAQLDERPVASARAAVLAAAARQVGARPVDAAAPRPTRQRWPLAAAAAVMLSTLAVMLAIRTSEEVPQFSAPPEAPRSAPESVVPPATPAPAPPGAEPSTGQREVRDRQVLESRPARTQERSAARANSETDAVKQAPREASRPALAEQPAASPTRTLEKEQQNVPAAHPAAPTPAAPEPVVRSKLRAEQSAAGAVAQTAPTDQASNDARRDAARSGTLGALSRAQSERKQVEESATAWLERIIKLRREGRHDEADAELKRFREHYPQVQPPPEALAPTGTR